MHVSAELGQVTSTNKEGQGRPTGVMDTVVNSGVSVLSPGQLLASVHRLLFVNKEKLEM